MEMNPEQKGSGFSPYVLVGIVILAGAILSIGSVLMTKTAHLKGMVKTKDSTTGTVTYTGNDGAVMYHNGTYPPGWPVDVPRYPKATIISAGTVEPTEGSIGYVVVLSIDATPDQATLFYENALQKNTWSMTALTNVGDVRFIAATKPDRTVAIHIAEDGSAGTTVTLHVKE